MRPAGGRLGARKGRAGQFEVDGDVLDARLSGLALATRVADGRLAPDAVSAAQGVLARAVARRELSADQTVVALAGATGSGKSSVFNALVGAEVARCGVRRPTTGQPMAALWGASPATGPLLDWLDVKRWHRVDQPATVAGGGAPPDRQAPADIVGPDLAGPDLTGLVLLDLPDHDSTHVPHRERVDRLVERADVMVWVLDPQKYADAAVHDNYLRRYARHAEVTVVLLNQVDRLSPEQAEMCLAHLRRLLLADGLRTARVIPTSAVTGAGLGELRELISDVVAQRRAALVRLAADVSTAADVLALAAADSGTALPVPSRASHDTLAADLAEAAGVGSAGRAVAQGVLRSGRLATGWPLIRWLGQRGRDPSAGPSRTRAAGIGPGTTAVPSADPAALAKAAAAIRQYAAAACAGAPPAWVRSTRAVASSTVAGLAAQLDSAMARCRLDPPRRPRWWTAVGVLQWVLLVTAGLGALWLLALAGLAGLALPQPQPPMVGPLPVPTALLAGGLLSGILLATMARLLNRRAAARAGRQVEHAVREEIARVARLTVLDPIEAELATLGEFRVGLIEARG